jgi:hypothetical protein
MKKIISKVKQPLMRKHEVIKVPKTVKIVVQPSKSIEVKLGDNSSVRRAIIDNNRKNQQSAIKPIDASPASPNTPQINRPKITPKDLAVGQKQVVIHQQTRSKKRARVIHQDTEISKSSAAKINALRWVGQGKILIIVGNGPSISEVSLEQIVGYDKIDIMSINKPDERVWPSDYWAFCDISQYTRHKHLWEDYDGVIINSTAIKHSKPNSLQIKNISGKGFSQDLLNGIYIGRSTVFANMQTALWMDYDYVYIFGCDMNPEGIDGKLHFYGTNPDVDPEVRKRRFEKEAEYYSYAANILSEEDRSKFVFCSSCNPWPFVEKYNSIGHLEAIPEIIERIQR